MTDLRKAAQRALYTSLLSAMVAWLLFMAARYSTILIERNFSSDLIYGDNARGIIFPSDYLIFAAIAVFAFTSMLAKNKLMKAQSAAHESSALVKPVLRFLNLAMIIALVLAAIAAVSEFMTGFLGGETNESALVRLMNTYLPIILHTALAVTVLLIGFVFGKQPAAQQPQQIDTGGDAVQKSNEVPEKAQRLIGLAYAIPIVSVATALILGLIVYDITQTALEVWIWVLILILVGAGIAAGCFCAVKGLAEQFSADEHQRGVGVGAKNISFVLSVIFASVVTLMSMSYGVTAVEQLRVYPQLSMNSYASAGGLAGDQASLPLPSVLVQVDGYDLKRGSDVRVALEPTGETVFEGRADASGYLYEETALPENIAEGEYTLVAHAISADDSEISVDFAITVSDDSNVMFPDGNYQSLDQSHSTVLTPSFSWVVSDLLPAFLLLVIAAGMISLTLNLRSRDGERHAQRA